MAAKGVNLLPEDDDGQDNDEPEDDYEDDLDEEISSRSRSRSGGGGIFRVIGIVFAAIVLLGGVAWAGYQFWWIPRLEKEQKKIEARKRLEDLREKRLEQAKAERARRKKELALLQEIRAEAEGKTAKKAETSTGGDTAKEAEKKKTAGTSGVTTGQMDGLKKPKTLAKSPKPGAEKIQPKVAKEIPQEEGAQRKPVIAVKKPPQKRKQVARAAPQPPVKMASPATPSKEEKEPPKTTASPEKPSSVAKVEAREVKIVPTKPVPVPPSPAPDQRFYSVQVATCRTKKCVTSFVRKLSKKGFRARVSKRIASSAPRTEVLLGEFETKREALPLLELARKKRLRVTLYQGKGSWRLSAGSFANIEDAAQRLDQIEDAGLKAKLAAREGTRRVSFRVVRTGRLSTRRSAIAMRRRVVQAGFSDSFVVIQKASK